MKWLMSYVKKKGKIMSKFYKIIIILCIGYLLSQIYEQKNKIDDLESRFSDISIIFKKELEDKIDLLQYKMADLTSEVDDIKMKLNIY